MWKWENAGYFPILPDSLASGRCRIHSGLANRAVKTPIRVKTPIAYPRSKTPIGGTKGVLFNAEMAYTLIKWGARGFLKNKGLKTWNVISWQSISTGILFMG